MVTTVATTTSARVNAQKRDATNAALKADAFREESKELLKGEKRKAKAAESPAEFAKRITDAVRASTNADLRVLEILREMKKTRAPDDLGKLACELGRARRRQFRAAKALAHLRGSSLG